MRSFASHENSGVVTMGMISVGTPSTTPSGSGCKASREAM